MKFEDNNELTPQIPRNISPQDTIVVIAPTIKASIKNIFDTSVPLAPIARKIPISFFLFITLRETKLNNSIVEKIPKIKATHWNIIENIANIWLTIYKVSDISDSW